MTHWEQAGQLQAARQRWLSSPFSWSCQFSVFWTWRRACPWVKLWGKRLEARSKEYAQIYMKQICVTTFLLLSIFIIYSLAYSFAQICRCLLSPSLCPPYFIQNNQINQPFNAACQTACWLRKLTLSLPFCQTLQKQTNPMPKYAFFLQISFPSRKQNLLLLFDLLTKMYDEHGKLIIIHEYQSQDLQPFLNPICKQTYNALPKIYGKNRKKKYYTQPNDVSLSLQRHKLARDCCSHHFEDNHRAVTDVKQLRKQKIDNLLAQPYTKASSRGKYENLHKSLEQMSSRRPVNKAKKKFLLPNLKDFYFQQLTERQSEHKIYQPTDGTPADSKPNNLTSVRNSAINEIRKNLKTDYSSNSEYVQTQEHDLEGSTRKKVKEHVKSLTEHDATGNKKYYEHLQNQRETKQDPRYKVADIKSSTHSQDDAFSISSSAIQKGNKLSTVFHKYKRKISSKNEDDRPEKKRSRVYSVLSNGLFKIPEEEEFQDYLMNYQPMNENFDIKSLVKQPNFHIVPADGKVYFGQITNKKKNGQGITVSQKQIFQGKYDQNMKTQGCQKNRDGIYRGDFVNGKRHGKGKFTWYNGEVFEGDWRQGKKNGFGTWKSPKGDSYEGEWKENRQTGLGIYVHYGGSKYRGEFKDFLKHGKGRQQFPNGDKYDGQYIQGKPHGKGKYVWANGDTYQGQFLQGSRSGFGILNRKSGENYEGHFANDMKHGWGKQTFKSGQQFEGEFKNGERFHGKLKTKAGAIINITQ